MIITRIVHKEFRTANYIQKGLVKGYNVVGSDWAAGLMVEELCDSGVGQRIFLFSKMPRLALGPNPASCSVGARVYFPGVKSIQGMKLTNQCLSSAKVKGE